VDQEGCASGQDEELGLDPRFWLRDRASAISTIKKARWWTSRRIRLDGLHLSPLLLRGEVEIRG
jgi:hypothetical protein